MRWQSRGAIIQGGPPPFRVQDATRGALVPDDRNHFDPPLAGGRSDRHGRSRRRGSRASRFVRSDQPCGRARSGSPASDPLERDSKEFWAGIQGVVQSILDGTQQSLRASSGPAQSSSSAKTSVISSPLLTAFRRRRTRRMCCARGFREQASPPVTVGLPVVNGWSPNDNRLG
jgi:hypothetical protein